MTTGTIDLQSDAYLSSIAFQAGVANLVTGLAGIALSAFFSAHSAIGYGAGFMIGMLSLYLSLKILRKGIGKGPDKAWVYITSRYYLRFFLVMALITLCIALLKISPVTIMIAFTATLFTTIGAMLYSIKGDLLSNAS